jgi:hypothetical protein
MFKYVKQLTSLVLWFMLFVVLLSTETMAAKEIKNS